MTAGETPALAIEGLHVDGVTRRGESLPVLRGVTFSVRHAEAVALVGESGSGKSMTCASIMRLLPSSALRISGGSVMLEGEELLTLSESGMQHIRGSRISMVVQDSLAALNPVLRVGGQVDEVLRHHTNLGRQQRRARTIELFSDVGIASAPQRLSDYPHQFSGGMRQRVVAAIAMGAGPTVLLADEPTTALDPTVATKVLGMLAKLQAEHQTALLFVTHDISLARRLCTKMVVMYGGRNVEEGPTQSVLHSPAHPYTKALVSCLPSAVTTPRTRLVEIPGEPLRAEGLATAGCSFAPRCPIADARCRSEDPPILKMDELHTVECWKPGDVSGSAEPKTGPGT